MRHKKKNYANFFLKIRFNKPFNL